MLLQFKFRNFASFRDEAILDLTATKTTEFKQHIVEIGKEKVLPTAAIYGANASGKSNVFAAFRFMASYVRNSLNYGEEMENGEKRSMPPLNRFLFDASATSGESLFEVYFIDAKDGKTYNYGFTLNGEGVREEWLNAKSKSSRADEMKRIFYRNTEEEILDMPGIEAVRRKNLEVSLNRETLAVSLGARLKIETLMKIKEFFLSCRIVNFGEPEETFVRSHLVPPGFKGNKAVQDKIVRYLSSFDSSIVGFNVQREKVENDRPPVLKIDALHRMIGSDETAALSFGRESAGTRKMFSLYPVLRAVLLSGSMLWIDEFHAHLHPLLVRAVVTTFTNPKTNPNHAQLIFTTHDAWQLNSGLLRRDEIWFAEKNSDGCSSLFSLIDFVDEEGDKIRKDENFEKNYLVGKYGAIPELKPFRLIGDEE